MERLIPSNEASSRTEDTSPLVRGRRRNLAVIGIIGLTALIFVHVSSTTHSSTSRIRSGNESGDVNTQIWHQVLDNTYQSCGGFHYRKSLVIDVPDTSFSSTTNDTDFLLTLEYSSSCLSDGDCQNQPPWVVSWNSHPLGTISTTGSFERLEARIALSTVEVLNSITVSLQQDVPISRQVSCLSLHGVAIEKPTTSAPTISSKQSVTRSLTQTNAAAGAAATIIHCRVTALNIMLDKKQTKKAGYFSQEDFVCIPIRSEDGQESDDYLTIVGKLENHVTVSQLRQAKNGTLLAIVRSSSRMAGSVTLSDDPSSFRVIDSPPLHWTHYQARTTQTNALGKQSLAIIRVSTRDSTPPMSLEAIRLHFAASRQSAAAQYKLCSFSKFQLQFTKGIDVALRDSIHDFTSGSELLDAATTELSRRYKIDSISDLADKVVFCLAPGTPGWVATAGVNFYRLVVNGDWCLSLSVAMHELGHTVGLIHSGAGSSVYGDESGYMGYGDKAIKWPRKCFNALNHWELGWYSDRHRTIYSAKSLTGPNYVTLAAFVDYQKTGENKKVILNIEDKYYLQYNRAKAFNQDTEEYPDKVVVIQDTVGYSSLLKGMDVGDGISLGVSGTTGKLVIKVCHRVDGTGEEPDYMVLSVAMNRAYCGEWQGLHGQ